MNTWKVILATMLIFGTGVVTGGLLVRQTHRMRMQAPPGGTAGWTRSGQANSAGGMRVEFLRRLERDLDLTADQQERIDRILKDSQERTRKLMEPVSPRLREELKQAQEDFREVLNPRQKKRFDELLRQQQERPRESRNPPLQRDRPPEGSRRQPGDSAP